MRVLIGIVTAEYARRVDFYDWFHMLDKPDDTVVMLCHGQSPAKGRNMIVEQSITHNCTHILFIDDDMAYRPDSLSQLLEHDKDIVSGLYFGRAYPHQPFIFDYFNENGQAHFLPLNGNKNRLIPIVAAGLGFCLVKTSVFEKLEKPWFRLGEIEADRWCDDTGFFRRVSKLGIKSYCDTECRVGHTGVMTLWPAREGDKWFTVYDTNGTEGVKLPQNG